MPHQSDQGWIVFESDPDSLTAAILNMSGYVTDAINGQNHHLAQLADHTARDHRTVAVHVMNQHDVLARMAHKMRPQAITPEAFDRSGVIQRRLCN